jgi:hypothetical protein
MRSLLLAVLFFLGLISQVQFATGAGDTKPATQSATVQAPDDPFQIPETDLMRAAPKAVFVAFMGNHQTPAVSHDGWAAWAHEGEGGKAHDPNHIDPTTYRRDIASAYYPAIGPYDMTDPDVAEYHCQLMKMAGIDGISFNLSFYKDDPWRRRSMRIYVDMMKRYGLLGMVRFENKFFPDKYPDHAAMIAQSYADMDAWLAMMEPVQYCVAGRPVFMLFTFKLDPDELGAWKEKFPPDRRPLILTYGADPKYRGVVDGRFGWTGDAPTRQKRPPYVTYVPPELVPANERNDRRRAWQLLESGQMSFYMGGVSPGFDDIGVWGWGNGPRKVERDDGRTYEYRWEQMLKTNFRNVFIPTWNDWGEGTVIEPAVDFGDKYLAMTRQYAAKFKSSEESNANLLLPLWIFKVRKTAADASGDMTRASELILGGDYATAEKIVAPWAKKLGVEEVVAWDPPTATSEKP